MLASYLHHCNPGGSQSHLISHQRSHKLQNLMLFPSNSMYMYPQVIKRVTYTYFKPGSLPSHSFAIKETTGLKILYLQYPSSTNKHPSSLRRIPHPFVPSPVGLIPFSYGAEPNTRSKDVVKTKESGLAWRYLYRFFEVRLVRGSRKAGWRAGGGEVVTE